MSIGKTYTLELSAWEVFTLQRIIAETFTNTTQRRSVVRKIEYIYYDAATSAEVRKSEAA